MSLISARRFGANPSLCWVPGRNAEAVDGDWRKQRYISDLMYPVGLYVKVTMCDPCRPPSGTRLEEWTAKHWLMVVGNTRLEGSEKEDTSTRATDLWA